MANTYRFMLRDEEGVLAACDTEEELKQAYETELSEYINLARSHPEDKEYLQHLSRLLESLQVFTVLSYRPFEEAQKRMQEDLMAVRNGTYTPPDQRLRAEALGRAMALLDDEYGTDVTDALKVFIESVIEEKLPKSDG